MTSLDRNARLELERNIDSILKKAKKVEESFGYMLRCQGIETNLETILSFINGMLYGYIDAFYVTTKGRHLNSEESEEFDNLLKGRAWEIREAFIATRMN